MQKNELLLASDDGQVIQAVDDAASVTLVAAEGESDVRKFDVVAYTGGDLNVGLYPVPAVVDLKGLQASDQWPMLLDHKLSQRVGHAEAVVNDGKQLRHVGVASYPSDYRDQVVQAAESEYPWQVSIGVRVLEAEHVPAGRTFQANGRTFTGPRVWVKRSKSKETSFVTVGADAGGASARLKAGLGLNPSEGKKLDFEVWLSSRGFDASDLTAEQTEAMQTLYASEQEGGTVTATEGEEKGEAAETDSGESPEDLVASMRQAAVEESRRVHGIRDLCAKYDVQTVKVDGKEVDLEAHAIGEGWDLQATELEALRHDRGTAPAVHIRQQSSSDTLQAMEGAMILRAGLELDHEAFGGNATGDGVPQWLRAGINDDSRQRVMEAAHRFGDRSMLDLAAEAVRIDGGDPSGSRNDMLRAAFSGATLERVFTTSINARVLATYGEADDSTREWCREVEVNDFRENEANRLKNGGSALDVLPRGGEITERSTSDTGETYRLGRYGEAWTIDEQDIIDDRFDLLDDVPDRMAMDASRLRPDLVYAHLLSNPAMSNGEQVFSAAHGNVLEEAMTSNGLVAARLLLTLMKEAEVTLDLRPTDLLIPEELLEPAMRLLNSTEVAGVKAEEGTLNVVRGLVTNLTTEARLSNGVVHPKTKEFIAGSSDAWYMFDRRNLRFLVAYLAGSGRRPRVRSHRYQTGKFGIRHEISLDIGTRIVTAKPIIRSQPAG